ncbi:Trp biosynthesis-associated membrane protein [Leucobacter sp. CSA1]|uniref:Trp biosynthesis-associated membrane protein n=1 Tax=Leucobacter chromiisoli TaxID=2796471 RepID=A0A934Q6I4_9MICO|nr:Trp biosynthesis-associated membrane protein [Leucobacter chromiisoli]MBK0419174.1 Trp biosynthesis-associated membrane protein [Leucobacter chromiisoli]
MRAKPLLLLGIALSGALSLLAATQTWLSFSLDSSAAAQTEVAVGGQELNPALVPVALALVACAVALTIAGPVFRRVLGGLVALLGAGIVALTAGVLASPLDAASGRITELTGLSGGAQAGLVVSSQLSPWAAANAALGVLAALLGVLVLVLGGRWAAAGRKYEAGSARAPRAAGPDRISDWDALSEGGDPTSAGEGADDDADGARADGARADDARDIRDAEGDGRERDETGGDPGR